MGYHCQIPGTIKGADTIRRKSSDKSGERGDGKVVASPQPQPNDYLLKIRMAGGILTWISVFHFGWVKKMAGMLTVRGT